MTLRPGADMVAFFVLLLAAFSRLVPHQLHGVGLNFTAVGGGLLFFGSRHRRRAALLGAAVMALTDVYLTCHVYGLAFHPAAYAVTWAWYGAICLLGGALLRRASTGRVVAAVVCSASSFFVLSNLEVWFGSGLYAHTGAGLARCFALAVPFYLNDLVSTGLTCTVLFGLPVLARQLVALWSDAAEQNRMLR